MRFTIETEQSFGVTYTVEADTPEEAWAELIDGNSDECQGQMPGAIIGTFENATIQGAQ